MSKYRQFSLEELAGMEDEFVNYLVVNGVTPEEWLSIKESDTEKTLGMLDSFSQVIWESILRKTQYLDLYEKQNIMAFYCGQDELLLRGMKTDDSSYDFRENESIIRSKSDPPKDLSSYASKCDYHKVREEEIYDLFCRGAQPSDGKLFHSLS